MFDFGKPEDTAKIFWENSLNGTGPKIPSCHWDEMEESDLLNVFTYLYRAIRQAYSGGASAEVLDVLVSDYDEIFVALATSSDTFKEVVRNGKHQPVLGVSEEQVYKYRRLAGV